MSRTQQQAAAARFKVSMPRHFEFTAQRSRKGSGQDEPDSTQTPEVPDVSGDINVTSHFVIALLERCRRISGVSVPSCSINALPVIAFAAEAAVH